MIFNPKGIESLQPICRPLIFQTMNFFRLNNLRLNIKGLHIQVVLSSEFVATTQFLSR